MDRLTAITLKPSRIAFYLHAVVLVLSVTALWLCGLEVWLRLLLTVLLLLVAIWQHRERRQLPASVIDLEQMELVNEQLVLPWLMVLDIREKKSGKKYALALWPDMASADDLRRLRVFLRGGG